MIAGGSAAVLEPWKWHWRLPPLAALASVAWLWPSSSRHAIPVALFTRSRISAHDLPAGLAGGRLDVRVEFGVVRVARSSESDTEWPFLRFFDLRLVQPAAPTMDTA